MSALHEDVLGLDVPVDHATAVGVTQRVGDLAGDPKGVVKGQLLLAREAPSQRLALDVGHDVVEQLARRARVHHRQDVGVAQTRRGLDLALEPPGADLGRQLGAEHLERDLTAVAEVLGQEHHRHAARAQLAMNAIARGQRILKSSEQLGHSDLPPA